MFIINKILWGCCRTFGGSKEMDWRLNPSMIVSFWYIPINIGMFLLSKKINSNEVQIKSLMSLSHLTTFQFCFLQTFILFWWFPLYLKILYLYLSLSSIKFEENLFCSMKVKEFSLLIQNSTSFPLFYNLFIFSSFVTFTPTNTYFKFHILMSLWVTRNN